MRLGLFLSTQGDAGEDPAALVARLRAQTRLARDLGYDLVLAPHHVLARPFSMLQPLPVLAALAGDAGRMRVGSGVLLLTLLNPLRVAEEALTMDAVTGGRFVLGVGLGYRSVEDRAFGVPERRVRVFLDKLAVVRRLLAGEEVTASGPGYGLAGARLSLRPVGAPPPVWMAANDDRGVRRAARHADAWLLNPHARVGDLARQMELFTATRGGPPGEVPCVREVCVAPTDEEALRVAAPHLAAKYRTYVDWGQSEVMPAGDTLRRGWEDLGRDRFLVGSVATVAAGLEDLRRRAGVTLVVARVHWPGMDPDLAERSLRLLAAAAGPGPGTRGARADGPTPPPP